MSDVPLKIFSLQNASASDAAAILQSVLPVSQNEEPLRIGVDARSNALIVSASEEKLKIIEAVLLRLDESDSKAKPQ
jgi:hypothetical protein